VKKKGSTQQTTQPKTPAAEKPSRALSRHKRKCTVCHHPERDHIEQEFLHWRSIRSIAKFYRLTDRAVYRHAHALVLALNPQPPASNLRFLIDSPNRERFHATHSKETIEAHSNRQKNTTFQAPNLFPFLSPTAKRKALSKGTDLYIVGGIGKLKWELPQCPAAR
jgi:hypothetical protein